MPTIVLWTDTIEKTRQNDSIRTYRPGDRHAAIVIRVPVRLAAFIAKVLPRERDLARVHIWWNLP